MASENTAYRTEHDSMGEVRVPADMLYGAQTQRSFDNFRIGEEKMPFPLIRALVLIKKAAAAINHTLLPERMTEEKCTAIRKAADKVLSGELNAHFPLSVWQTGSGTQTNMNVNEVIANQGNLLVGYKLLHPNDDVNMSQSSNDTFPAAMHICVVTETQGKLLPALDRLIGTLTGLEQENNSVIKSGRTHLQDATPIRFSQEISGWRASLEKDRELIQTSLDPLCELALGGTAVGTGLNAPKDFDKLVAEELARLSGEPFRTSGNKFHSLTSKDELVFAHGALKALAADLFKIASDIRLLSSGPRCGLGEIIIPANEPGSSIMPGKVNPTQCEAVTMVALQVMGNDVTVGLAASQGHLELNVFMPVCIYNYLQSVNLLADAIDSFEKHCVNGLKANREVMEDYLQKSLMLATALTPYIGYEKAARVVGLAHREGLTLRKACLQLGYLDGEAFDAVFHPEVMC